MIVYLSFFQSKIPHPIPAYSFWEYYIKNGIKEAGYEWVEGAVDWAEGLMYSFDKAKLNTWKAETWTKTLEDIKEKHTKSPVSLFLSYLYPHQVDELAIKEIQKLGIPCVNFFCDNVREFTKAPKEFKPFDLNWVPEFKALEMYKKVNYNFIHLPMPMWVAPQYRKISTLETNNVSFIGSKDIQRWMLFENLANNHKFEIQIMGSGWQDKSESKESIKIQNTRLQTIKNQFDFITKFGLSAYSRKLQQRNISLQNSNQLQKLIQQKPDFEKYIQVTKESMVTLGVNRYPSYLYPLEQASTYSRLRDIEAPMLGACYLTEYTEGLESLYDIGNEIEVYKNGNELIEKIKYLASNSSKRKDFRRNGQARALKNHAILNSLKAIFEKLWK